MKLKTNKQTTKTFDVIKSKKLFDKECVNLNKSVHKLGREKLKHPEKNLIKTK